ncbi:DUF2169 domain-containing protein [Sulfidibacter corallicola]|uniref:DUF2169 domain-containing protein n=1 Tax=Sulfidibacter corallicola TaxID=2818388 RepID=A0A8A4TJ56_SULCO|nr:DUF2169 domain-containing protein [Sulfidibacter corallicola]QTD49517.1 DUF2169 domain-containing protein [Sulfidibacter corallicola]
MELINYTPFPPLFFKSRDKHRVDHGVLVLRGTFAIDHEAYLRPIPDQEPVRTEDVFHGDPTQSSLVFEADLAPFKPATDIHLNAIARAPGGKARRTWPVSARVGTLRKDLYVTGPRRFFSSLGLWQLSIPKPVTEVPIRYELAFGGGPGKSGKGKVYEHNPVGVGYQTVTQTLNPIKSFEAPCIEAADKKISLRGRNYRPEGFSPIARAWLPRRGFAGTYDQKWVDDVWPELPADFDYRFYNSAHPDLIYSGYLVGGEAVELRGLRPERELLRFGIPEYKALVLIRYGDGSFNLAPAYLDTLALDVADPDPNRIRAYLTWRATIDIRKPIRRLEARLDTSAVDGKGGSRG